MCCCDFATFEYLWVSEIWIVRYKHFDWLYHVLVKKFGGVIAIPPLPEKQVKLFQDPLNFYLVIIFWGSMQNLWCRSLFSFPKLRWWQMLARKWCNRLRLLDGLTRIWLNTGSVFIHLLVFQVQLLFYIFNHSKGILRYFLFINIFLIYKDKSFQENRASKLHRQNMQTSCTRWIWGSNKFPLDFRLIPGADLNFQVWKHFVSETDEKKWTKVLTETILLILIIEKYRYMMING